MTSLWVGCFEDQGKYVTDNQAEVHTGYGDRDGESCRVIKIYLILNDISVSKRLGTK